MHRHSSLLPALALGLAFLTACADRSARKPDSDAEYRQEIEAWRQERVDGLKKDDGWFTLVGLFWLDEGENRFGSDPQGKVVLPEGKSPKVAGVLVRRGDKVSVRVEPGAKVTSGGKPVTAMELKTDASKERTVLEMGSVSFFVIQRGDRLGVRVRDKQSAALAAFHGLDNYPIQPAWRIEARFEPYDPPKNVAIPNVLGQVIQEPSPGAIAFAWQGEPYRLDALGDPAKGLSLIFADQTNGKETYGAGRFLETGPVEGGKVVVDFNTAYNPPCAFTAFATCPLPPAQNRLALRVEAGEKKYAGASH